MADFFNYIINWVNTQADRLTSFAGFFLEKLMTRIIRFMTWILEKAKDENISFLNDLQLITNLESYWANIPNNARALLELSKIPECIVILLAAYAVRIFMAMTPFR